MIFAIDTDSYGFHVHPEDGRYQTVATSKKIDVERRRILVFSAAKQYFSRVLTNGGNDVFCEEPLALKNPVTTRVLCLMAGAIWSAHADVCITHRIDSSWHWVDVSSWKKRIVGSGNATKEQIRDFVTGSPLFFDFCQSTFRPHVVEEDHEKTKDLYDAWCILQYGKWFKGQEEMS